MVPYWRRFRQWQDRRPPSVAYAEIRRQLLEHGYTAEDFEKSEFADVMEILAEGYYRRETVKLRNRMGGTWPGDFRRLLIDTVATWVEDARVMNHWRIQVGAMGHALGQYRRQRDFPCPWPFSGGDPRSFQLQDHMPAVYTAIARLHDRLNQNRIVTEEIDIALLPIPGRDTYTTSLPTFFPGMNTVRLGRDVQYVDLDIVRQLVEYIRRDLITHGLLHISPVPTEKGTRPRKKRGRKREYDPADDAKLVADWIRAREAKVRKAEFCRDEGITERELNNAIGRIGSRKRYARESQP
jgi:hypothetical protein